MTGRPILESSYRRKSYCPKRKLYIQNCLIDTSDYYYNLNINGHRGFQEFLGIQKGGH